MTEPLLLVALATARTTVTAGRGGQYAQAVVDGDAAWNGDATDRALRELRRRLAPAIPIGGEVRLVAEWVDTGPRTVLVLTMGAPL